MKNIKKFLKDNQSIIFLVIIVLLALKVFVPQIEDLKESVAALKEADLTWMLAGTIVFFLGLPILAWQFLELALKPIAFYLTWRVEMAGLFVSKLLPSSLGTLSLNLYYLHQQKHTVIQASTVMAMNAFTSGIAYAILVVLALSVDNYSIGSASLSDISLPVGVIALVLLGFVALGIMLYKMPKIRSKIKKTIADVKSNLHAYKGKPRAVVMGIVLNGIGSLTSLFALYASAHAIGVDLSMSAALVAYTFGNIAVTLVPTPGGIGAAEAGIYSGLVLVGVDSSDALIITLLYRLISYWIPILPGYYYFRSLRHNVLSKFSIKNKQQPAS